MNAIIAPSILTVSKDKIIEKIKEVESLGIKWIHFDIMDGKFVRNTTFSYDELSSFCKHSNSIHDVHLMINNPDEMVEKYAASGANILTFHYEALASDELVLETINRIHASNMRAGISIKPNTDISKIFKFLHNLDLVLIMSVEPGEGGQQFIKESLNRIADIKKYLNDNNLNNVLIEVDGGINDLIAKECVEAGADVLVMGSFIFNHSSIAEQLKKING